MKNKKVIILLAILAFIMGAVFISCAKHSGDKQLWTCPMHTSYITDKVGDCPICGMKLVKVEKSISEEPKVQENQNAIADHTSVKISLEKQQLINVRLDSVAIRPLAAIVEASGVVANDPELYYVEEQLIAANKEYKSAIKTGSVGDIQNAKNNLKSAQTRMEIMGFDIKQIKAMALKKSPDKSLLGTGNNFKSWIYAQVYQDDLKNIKKGAFVEISSTSTGSVSYRGRVVAIDPSLNAETRSALVRITFINKNFLLKPEMYVDVKIRSFKGRYLSIPEEAIINSGTKQIAFVSKEDGYFEPRNVEFGEKIGDYYVIKNGLLEGEKIVVNGNFMIDSESQLKAALTGFNEKNR